MKLSWHIVSKKLKTSVLKIKLQTGCILWLFLLVLVRKVLKIHIALIKYFKVSHSWQLNVLASLSIWMRDEFHLWPLYPHHPGQVYTYFSFETYMTQPSSVFYSVLDLLRKSDVLMDWWMSGRWMVRWVEMFIHPVVILNLLGVRLWLKAGNTKMNKCWQAPFHGIYVLL